MYDVYDGETYCGESCHDVSAQRHLQTCEVKTVVTTAGLDTGTLVRNTHNFDLPIPTLQKFHKRCFLICALR